MHEDVSGSGHIFELETPYPDNYQEIVAQVDRENEMGCLPPLKTRIHDLKDYDTVFIGFPTWDMQCAATHEELLAPARPVGQKPSSRSTPMAGTAPGYHYGAGPIQLECG